MTRSIPWLPALALVLLLHGCASPHSDNLYLQLGEREGIAILVDEFLFSLSENEQALPLFRHTDIERFREQFALQLCALSGGPCNYRGDSMADTHRGMNISRAQFNSVVDDLIAAMERSDLSTPTQNALLAKLAPLYGEIAEQ